MFNIANILGINHSLVKSEHSLKEKLESERKTENTNTSLVISRSLSETGFRYTSVIKTGKCVSDHESEIRNVSKPEEGHEIKTNDIDDGRMADDLMSSSKADSIEKAANEKLQEQEKKKFRTSFTKSQLEKLEACFRTRKYLTVRDREALSQSLKLSDVQIKTWYQNRRTKWKREIGRCQRSYPASSCLQSNRCTDCFLLHSKQRSNERIDKNVEDDWAHICNDKDSDSDGSQSFPKCQEDDTERSLYDVEETFFRSITNPETYEMIKRWYFNVFMYAFATPEFKN